MPVHQVAQGDTLITIANQYGFADWQKIYKHPSNDDLRAQRPNPMVLNPGDKVFVPDKEPKVFERRTGSTYTFKIRKLICTFATKLLDECGQPYAGCKYELKVGSDTFSGTVPNDGVISHEVPPDQKTGTLKLWPNPDDPDEVVEWDVEIGSLDPVETISGVQARLNNLGFNAGTVDGTMNDQTTAAIKDFQIRIGYDTPTGELDEQTRQALLDAQKGY